MDPDSARLHTLFHLYTNATCTAEERHEYLQLVKQQQYADALQQLIQQQLEQADAEGELNPARAEAILRSITGGGAGGKRIALRRWAPWLAAAVLLLAAAGVWLVYDGKKEQGGQPPVADNSDIRPGANKALLTLADGTVVALDSAGNQVIQQGAVAIRQQAGSLQYDVQEGKAATGTNLLTTPRGGQFRIVLPDGTKVWLNAESSIKYPVVFAGKERRVTVTGEAYFEVAARADMPFMVEAGRHTALQVLGTRFNINSYDNEPALVATLLQGSIKLMQTLPDAPAPVILRPGEQVAVQQRPGGKMQADTARVMAWKNGVFNLDGVDIKELMRQLERWYDIRVVYAQQPPDIRLFGKISRNKTLNNFLKALEDYEVKFKRQGNTLIVLPGA